MSVRYRLFLMISGLFVFIAVCSAFLENYVMKHELAKTQVAVRAKIRKKYPKDAARYYERSPKLRMLLKLASAFIPGPCWQEIWERKIV
jgi:hypothetical protein